jgi:hypothetical protein
MRRFRCPLRLRTALALVAAAAAAMGAVRLIRLRAEYLSRAEYYAGREGISRGSVEFYGDMFILYRPSPGVDPGSMPAPDPDPRRMKTAYLALTDFYSALRRKYECAASRPWLSVPPDPPKPFADEAERWARSEWADERAKFPWLTAEPAGGFSPE